MISVINCSPKYKSNSSNFIKRLVPKLRNNYQIIYLYHEEINDIINKIDKSNVIVFVFPLYVDTVPSRLIRLMEQNINFKNKYVYSISNCGFLEKINNDIAIKIIQNWCLHCNGIFMGSFKIGAGEVIGNDNFLSHLLSPLYKIKMTIFSKRINKIKKVNLSTQIILPKRMFCYCANKGFKKTIAKYSKT